MGCNIITPLNRLGAWLARVDNTVYQADKYGFVCGERENVGGGLDVVGKTDNSNRREILE